MEPGHQGRRTTTTRSRWTDRGARRRAGRRPTPASVWSAGSSTARRTVAGRAERSCSTAAARSQATYEKLHLPEEEGFWETSHYEPGNEPPRRIDAFGLPIGVQLCSDNNRPEGTHLLGAQGVGVMLNPRASEERTYQRWKTVWRANALTSACYVLSVNRPHPEQGVLIGGPSVAIDPRGEVLLETTDTIAIVTLDGQVVADARRALSRLPAGARSPLRRCLGGDRRD